MPRGDGTGPMGQGPMTGRGAGYCAGYPVPGYANSWGGRMGMAWGRGRGGGRGYGRGGYGTGARWMGTPVYPAYAPMQYPYPTPDPQTQAAGLQSQAEQLRDMLEQIEEQIRALKEEE